MSAKEALSLMEKVLERLEGINALVALNKIQLSIDFNEIIGEGKNQIFGHMGFNSGIGLSQQRKYNFFLIQILCNMFHQYHLHIYREM